jgi:hypothetical protein
MAGAGSFRSAKQPTIVRSAMNEAHEPGTEADQRGTGVRKPWHTPCLAVAELASTDAMCNTGDDGGPAGSSFS